MSRARPARDCRPTRRPLFRRPSGAGPRRPLRPACCEHARWLDRSLASSVVPGSEAFRALPERYLGAPPGFDATYHVRLGDIGHTWEVAHARRSRARRAIAAPRARRRHRHRRRRPGWRCARAALRRRGVLAAPALRARRPRPRRRLRGPVPAPRRPRPAAAHPRVSRPGADLDADAGRRARRPAACTASARPRRRSSTPSPRSAAAPTASTRSTCPASAARRKPARAPTTRPGSPTAVLGVMDALEIERAHLVGNSMGGRVAIEVGLRAPERVSALAPARPGVAFVARDLAPLVRLLRPELGLLPHPLRARIVRDQFWALFADRERSTRRSPTSSSTSSSASTARAARASPSSPRRATSTSTRRYGRDGFYPRLAELEPPALFVWGSHDRLIPPRVLAPRRARRCRGRADRARRLRPRAAGRAPEQTNGLIAGGSLAPAEAPAAPRRCSARLARSAAAERRAGADGVRSSDERPRDPRRSGAANGHGTGQRGRLDGARRARRRRPGSARAGGAAPARWRRRRREPALAGGVLGLRQRARRCAPTSTSATPTTSARTCRAVAAGHPLLPRRGARPGQHPRGRPGAAGRQPLRRQPDAGHDRLHARLLDLLRRRAALLPARPQPRARLPGRAASCASTAPSPPRRERRARRSTPAPRCSSTRAATTRSTGRPGRATGSTSAAARASSGSRSTQDVPIVPVVSIGGQETALFLSRGERLAQALRLDRLFRLKVLPISLALPWGLNVGDMLGHIPLPAKITIEVAAADRPARAVRPRARRRRGLRPRHAADAGDARRAGRRAPLAGDRMMRVDESIVDLARRRSWSGTTSPTPPTTCTSCPASRAGRSTASSATGLGARYRMLMRVGSAEVGGLIEIVECQPSRATWPGPRSPASTSAAAGGCASATTAARGSSCASPTASPAPGSPAGSPSSVAAPHARRATCAARCSQLKRQVEHEQLRADAAAAGEREAARSPSRPGRSPR